MAVLEDALRCFQHHADTRPALASGFSPKRNSGFAVKAGMALSPSRRFARRSGSSPSFCARVSSSGAPSNLLDQRRDALCAVCQLFEAAESALPPSSSS